jgi:Cys-tRNA(Pro)/Cys-tRNA(Cys) deacylase
MSLPSQWNESFDRPCYDESAPLRSVRRAQLRPGYSTTGPALTLARFVAEEDCIVSKPFERIMELLAAVGVTAQVHEHAAVRTIEEAHQLAPHLVENLVKTIAFEIEPGQRIVLAAVARDAQVDYKQLSVLLGCNRRALRLMPAARVEAELGFEVGGLGPFAVRPDIEVVIDQAVMAQPWLRCGAGLRTRTLQLRADDVLRASAARVAAIAKRAD